MSVKNEIELLKRECLTANGKPKKDCDLEKLRKLVELQASESFEVPVVENAPDDEKELKAKYDELVSRLFEIDPGTGDNRLRKGVTAKMLARWYRLRDKLRQPKPKAARVSVKPIAGGMVEVTIEKGPPVELEGQLETDEWKIVAQVMSMGGRARIPAGRYKAFRIKRGTNQPEYHEPPVSSPVPKNKQSEKNKKQFDTVI